MTKPLSQLLLWFALLLALFALAILFYLAQSDLTPAANQPLNQLWRDPLQSALTSSPTPPTPLATYITLALPTLAPASMVSPTLSIAASSTPPADQYVTIIAQSPTNAFSQPTLESSLMGVLLNGDIVRWQAEVTDHLQFLWYEVQTDDGISAWIPAANGVRFTPDGPIPPPLLPNFRQSASIVPTPTPTPEELLRQTPTLANINGAALQIYAEGQRLGRKPNAFVKVGDSNTYSATFLRPFDAQAYDLGDYPELAEVVTFYQGSFERDSLAGQVGFNLATVQDPLFADEQACQANETPLLCEYRLWQPSMAIVMFGANDVIHLPPERYETYLRTLIDDSIAQGIIPILTTFPRRPDATWEQVIALNAVMVRVGNEYQLPIINLWLAAQNLPASGLSGDNIHLNQGGEEIIFKGQEGRWGHTLRNLLTLQMLDALQQQFATLRS